jgi:hypothetical protein
MISMRKHKKWWMGLGIGVILGATLLQLIHFAETQSQALMVAETEKIYSQKELDEKLAKAVEGARQEPLPSGSANGPGASLKPKPEPTPSESPSALPSESPSEPPAPSGQGDRVVAFYVNSGMDLKTVARSLRKLGVIEDANDFMEEARSISRKIEVGTSSFKGKPTFEEIMDELTRPKND